MEYEATQKWLRWQLGVGTRNESVKETSRGFNRSRDDRNKVIKYMRYHRNILLQNYSTAYTTLSGSHIDLTFSRYMHSVCNKTPFYPSMLAQLL